MMSDNELTTTGDSASLAMKMVELAKDKDFDANKLEIFYRLQKDMVADDARKAYISAIATFHENPPQVVKSKPVFGKDRSKGPQYFYAQFEDTIKVVRPALLKVGIIATWSSKPVGNGITEVTCFLRHTLGHEESSTQSGGPEAGGSKNSVQAVISTDSYLRRASLMSVTGLVAEGEDTDGLAEKPDEPVISEEQLERINDLVEKSGIDLKVFCGMYGDLNKIKQCDYEKALGTLKLRLKVKTLEAGNDTA